MDVGKSSKSGSVLFGMLSQTLLKLKISECSDAENLNAA